MIGPTLEVYFIIRTKEIAKQTQLCLKMSDQRIRFGYIGWLVLWLLCFFSCPLWFYACQEIQVGPSLQLMTQARGWELEETILLHNMQLHQPSFLQRHLHGVLKGEQQVLMKPTGFPVVAQLCIHFGTISKRLWQSSSKTSICILGLYILLSCALCHVHSYIPPSAPYDPYGGYSVAQVPPVAPAGYAPVQVDLHYLTEILKSLALSLHLYASLDHLYFAYEWRLTERKNLLPMDFVWELCLCCVKQNTKDNPPCNTLFIGNLGEATSEAELRGLFSGYGLMLCIYEFANRNFLIPVLFSYRCGPTCLPKFV